jgi:hypothetical protein
MSFMKAVRFHNMAGSMSFYTKMHPSRSLEKVKC